MGHHHPYSPGVFLGSPFWADDYYSGGEQSPSVYIVPAAPASEKPSPVIDQPKPAVPLMIELQGDRYVRLTPDAADSTTPQPDRAPSSSRQLAPYSTASGARVENSELTPSVFVFRDGHREESSDYSIISGVIYAQGNYWTTGSWSKRILIADLDVPATLKANRERGVSFRLPSAPNEVITRP
jgi:hypothetical protein